MKVLITGADGLLGSNLVRLLLERKYDVSVLIMEENNASGTLSGLNVNRFYGNILNPAALHLAFKGQDVVIHAAAIIMVYPAKSKRLHEVNVEGTMNVINACGQHKIKRLIHVGTANSFGNGNIANPGNEESPYQGFKYGLDYMDSKRSAQDLVLQAVKEKGLPALIVNPTFLIGPYDSKPNSGAMILGLYEGKVPGYTKGSKNYIAAKDAATAVANAIEMGEIGECYILGNQNYSYEEAFSIIGNEIGVKPPKIKLPNTVVKMYGRVNSLLAPYFRFYPAVTKELAVISCEDHCYSGQKARDVLKMPVTPLNVAVRETFEWFKENGYLKNGKHV
jgi:dihydroflavonol-4-reductase